METRRRDSRGQRAAGLGGAGLLLLLAGGVGSWADEAGPAGGSQAGWVTAAVADFNELGGYTGRGTGMRCAEWTQRLLNEAERWRLVPREEAVAAQKRAGLRPPFEAGHLQRLADMVRAELMVSGAVGRVGLDYRKATVLVAVRVEVTEATSGELVMAANGNASAKAVRDEPRPTDELVEEALRAACIRAVQELLKPPALMGRILAKSGSDRFRTDLTRKSGMGRDRRLLIARQEGEAWRVIGVGLVQEVKDDHSVIVGISPGEAPRLGDLVVAP